MTNLVDVSGDHFVNNPFVDFGEMMTPEAHLVHVTGSGPNVFGHTLLCFHVANGYYGHVHKPGANYPSVIMGESAFKKYLTDERKTVLKRDTYLIGDNRCTAAQLKLKERLSSKYTWLGALHNCAEWASDIINAGRSGPEQIKLTSCGMSLPTLMLSKTQKARKDGKGNYDRLND